MSRAITNAILEGINGRLTEMPEGGDSPMGLLGQVLDTATSMGWSYDETNFANDEGGYEFYQYSPAGEDFSFAACYGSKDLSDDEKGAALIKDITDYAEDFDEEEHAQMWIGGNGAPGLKALVQDAEDIQDMLTSLADELAKISHPMNESYVYNWKDDVEDVEASEENDEIWYAVAENMCETGNNEGYGSDPYEVMSNIINLFKISKRSRLYKYLLKWYGSEEKLKSEVRDIYETGDAIYFTTGSGYAIFDADLLGGNADGETERKFNQFVDKEEGLNEGALEPEFSGRKSFYGKAHVNDGEDGKTLRSYDTDIMTIKDGNIKMLCGEDALTQTTLRHIKEFLQQNGLEPLSKKQLIDLINKGMNESAKVKLTELDSFEYKGHKYIPVGNIKSNKALPRLISNSISDEYNKDYNYDDFYKVAPNYDIFKVDGTDTLVVPGSSHLFSFNGDSDSYIPINNIKSDEELRTIDSVGYIGNEYDKEIVDDILSDKSYSDIAYDIGWGLNVYQLYNLANLYINNKNVRSKIEELLTDINYHTECETLSENPEEFKNKIMTELNSSNLSESINLKYLKRLTEAPEDISEEEEEYELVNNAPEETAEEMSDDEVEEEAEEDAKDTVEDDIEQPWYATTPELDELRDILPDLDYRLFLINADMICIGRLNGPDIEFLTSKNNQVIDDADVSESNAKAEEVEERAEEQEEDSFEYLWIKRPETLDEFLKQVNVLYLSPELSDEDKDQYAGLEASHESVMNYLMNELPEGAKEESEDEVVEEEPSEEAPAEEEPEVNIEIKKDEEEEK